MIRHLRSPCKMDENRRGSFLPVKNGIFLFLSLWIKIKELIYVSWGLIASENGVHFIIHIVNERIVSIFSDTVQVGTW